MADHAYVQHGSTIRFIAKDGTVVDRTHVDSLRVGTTDIRIGILNADLPPTIKPAKLLPDDWFNSLTANRLPLLFLDQEEKALVIDLKSISATPTIFGNIILQAPIDTKRLDFYGQPADQDSGNPVFILVNNEVVLLGCFHYPFTAHSLIGDTRAGVLDAIATLGANDHAPVNVSLDSTTTTTTTTLAPTNTTTTTTLAPTTTTTTTTPAPTTFNVSVVGVGAYGAPPNVYVIDGNNQQTLSLIIGSTYIFNQSAASNVNHPLRFSITSNGTHGGGIAYTSGVTVFGTPGQGGAYTQIVVDNSTPSILYYYCTQHAGMGGTINITSQ